MVFFFFFTLCQSIIISYENLTDNQHSICKSFSGSWAFDAWGADGSLTKEDKYGAGAFYSVDITFAEEMNLCFFVGQSPSSNQPESTTIDTRTYYYFSGGITNGGSSALSSNGDYLGSGGGGYTAITFSEKEMDYLLIVGSGGGSYAYTSGAPGGLKSCVEKVYNNKFFQYYQENESACNEEQNISGGTGVNPPGFYPGPAGGGAGYHGGAGGSPTTESHLLYGRGGSSYLNLDHGKHLTINLNVRWRGDQIPQEEFYQKPTHHGTFRLTKLVLCPTTDPECKNPDDCRCFFCPAHCLRCNNETCLACEDGFKKDDDNPFRCYVDTVPFSESFDFTVSEDFSKSFIFNATDVFSPTRSEKVIVVPENDTKFIIIGGAVGGVVVIAAVVIVLIIFIRRRKQLPFTSNADEDSMKETVIPLQEDQLTIDDSSDSSMLSQHGDDPFLPVNYQNDILTE